MSILAARHKGTDRQHGPYRQLRADSSTHTIQTIEYEHHEIHAGEAYSATYVFTIGGGNTANILIVTPDSDKEAHMNFDFISDDLLKAQFFEGADYAGGTAVPAINHNRRSSNTSGLTITRGAADSGGGTGTELYVKQVGSFFEFGEINHANEYILDRNQTYLFLMSGSNGDVVSAHLSWYEHTPKN